VANPAFIGPVTASDGIHDSDVTLDSTLMAQTVGRTRPGAVVRQPADRKGCQHTFADGPANLVAGAVEVRNGAVDSISVLLADDNLIVREGVRALLKRDPTIDVVGVAGDFDELIAQAVALTPQVLVTDIRMPPTFQNEGIEGAKEVRKRLPGTGIVVLSQYDSPEYAVELLSSGAAGYAYLLKDRVADSDRLAHAIREVATGGSMLDPEIVNALVSPVRSEGALSPAQENLLVQVAEGRPVKGDRERHWRPSGAGQRLDRGSLPRAREERVGRPGGRTAAVAHAAHGDPRTGGAGPDAVAAAARGPG
jgi:DNA-binding NarL/FixJ family response regulator